LLAKFFSTYFLIKKFLLSHCCVQQCEPDRRCKTKTSGEANLQNRGRCFLFNCGTQPCLSVPSLAVKLTQSGVVSTQGEHATAIFAQSIGATGGVGEKVQVDAIGSITTKADHANAALVQSVGDGGAAPAQETVLG